MASVTPLNPWKHQLQQGERGVKKNLTNLMLHLRNLDGLGREFRFNEQTQHPEWQSRKLEDNDFIDIRMIVERAGYAPPDKDVRPAVLRCCSDNSYNPIADYLSGLVWDGQPRIDLWMTEMLGAADNAFVQAISSKSLIASVARIMQPGCQVDTMVVLEGEQGVRKSSAIQALFGTDHAFEVVSGFDNHKQLAMSIMGAWAVELAEFVSVTKSHPGAVKGLVSMRHDRVVLPYGRSLTDLPRRCTFWGTINPGASGYLEDDTGNRRYWPVNVTAVDIDAIVQARDQLWAEAMHRYRAGERWWLQGKEVQHAERVQSARQQDEPWEDILREKLGLIREITPTKAMQELGIPYERMDKRAQMRIAKALKGIGFVSRTPKDSSGKTFRIWTRDP